MSARDNAQTPKVVLDFTQGRVLEGEEAAEFSTEGMVASVGPMPPRQRNPSDLAEHVLDERTWPGVGLVKSLGLELLAVIEERDRYRTALKRVRDNARAWHGPGNDGPAYDGHPAALKVIAEWCDAALAEPAA